jgi:hypothetical protein
MVNVDSGVDNIDVGALAAFGLVFILGEGAERQLVPMADTGKTLGVGVVWAVSASLQRGPKPELDELTQGAPS